MGHTFKKRRVLLPLTLSAVYDAARYLMLTHSNTTTAEVMEFLSDLDFKVNYLEVKMMMDHLEEDEDDWSVDFKGVYSYKRDTDDHLETILQKGKNKIKVMVDGRKLIISPLKEEGKKLIEFISNRKAIYSAEKLLTEKLQEGYYCAI